MPYVRLELKLDDAEDGPAFVPSVETDRHAAAAAARYFIQQASAELIEASLVHDDSELLAEWIAAGDGFGGRIVGVRDDGTGRSTRPIWTIEDNAKRQLRLRPGSRIAAVGFSGRQGEVRSIVVAGDGRTSIEVEITARKTNREPGPGIHSLPPTSDQLLGKSAAFVAAPAEGLSRTKSFNVWESSGPGAWLTHAKPSPKISRVSDEDADDVAEVETAMGRRGEGQSR